VAFLFLYAMIVEAINSAYPWSNGNKEVLVSFDSQNLVSFLNNICRTYHCRVSMDNGLSLAKITMSGGNHTFKSYTELLNFLSNKYGFSWFYFNNVLYIGSRAYTMEIISLPPEYINQFKSNMQNVGLYNNNFGWSINLENSFIMVSGPEKYVELVKNYAKNYAPLPRGNDFSIIRLKFANAQDINLNLNSQNFVVPGVVTILNNLLNPYIMQQNQIDNGLNQGILLDVVKNTKSDPAVNHILQDLSSKGNEGKGTDNGRSQYQMTTFPIVQADTRNNAVIIFDKKANLSMYEKLVRLLDRPQKMVQVDTTIVDINEDYFNSLGVNWAATLFGAQVGFNTAQLAQTTNAITISQSSIVGNSVLSNFMTNINVLAQKGLADVSSTPTIVTMNDFPTMINFSSQLYYFQQASLNTNTNNTNNNSPSQVAANSSIVVTPHILNTNALPKGNVIRLEVLLQSQQLFDQDNTTSYPVINGGGLQSQAVVQESQSLVLGGYTQNKKVKFTSGVPGLMSIPLLGYLFKSEITKTVTMKRMYIVTVKVLPIPSY